LTYRNAALQPNYSFIRHYQTRESLVILSAKRKNDLKSFYPKMKQNEEGYNEIIALRYIEPNPPNHALLGDSSSLNFYIKNDLIALLYQGIS